ncbi:LCP family protein [Deinococcus sp. Leaf326]|uniref:LCP family protein n=1 Tax=Deinococcus sp. Leaf326 TaxID=1736338 RepID=UPI0006FDB096|nr:LCP family protein [Deinococcus sp. Leaf326]KQQ97739.1 LytR family transcriptional regulator [Deinococcus sp. Leaf326]
MTHSDPLPPTPRAAARRANSLLRAAQAFGLSLSALTLGGFALLGAPGTAAPVTTLPGQAPQFTVLLAGRDVIYCYYRQPCRNQDQRTGLVQTPNTDTLMLVKVSGDRVDVLNIPRDTTVGEFSWRQSAAAQKVNSKYWSGGPEALTRAVEEITGERVDSYVVVRTDYVARVIDALGGLDVTVPEPGIEWVDQAAGVNLKLTPGNHHLGGDQAVLFLRVRKGFGDDYGRIDHQKQALTQLAARLKSPQGLVALPTILGGVGNGVETNVDPNLLPSLLPHLSAMRLRFATLPTDTIRGSFNLAPDRERLAQVWGAAPVRTGQDVAGTARPAPVRVTIQDASGADLGEALARALKVLGYAQVQVQRAPASSVSSQVFTQQDVGAAETLADLLGLPRLQGERFPVAPGEVGILLGADAAQQLAGLRAYQTPTTPTPVPIQTPTPETP